MLSIHLINTFIENLLLIARHHPGYYDYVGEQARPSNFCLHGADGLVKIYGKMYGVLFEPLQLIG